MVRLSMVKTVAAKPLSSSFTDRANPDSYPVRRRGTFSQNPRGNCQLAASSLARCYIQLFSPDLKFLTERPVRNRSGKTRGKQQHSGYWELQKPSFCWTSARAIGWLRFPRQPRVQIPEMSDIRPSLCELERNRTLKTSGKQVPERASSVFVFVLYIPHLLDTET
jgi:hypothetical protein